MNVIGHRDYSISGTDIQIKLFDDHLTVENPGTLPSLVRTNNIREIHFYRNPKIFEFLHEYEYVKEFGEGVDRMFRDLSHEEKLLAFCTVIMKNVSSRVSRRKKRFWRLSGRGLSSKSQSGIPAWIKR